MKPYVTKHQLKLPAETQNYQKCTHLVHLVDNKSILCYLLYKKEVKMEYSLVILKPDCLQRHLSEEVIRILKNNGFEIVFMKQQKLNKDDIEYIYAECRSEKWFTSFVEFMTSSDSLILVVKHKEGSAISRLNKLVGPTDPRKAGPSTIRYMGENIQRNLIHSTKDEKSFWREFAYFFGWEGALS